MPERVGQDLVFPSFKGNLYRVSDSGKAPKLVEKFSVVEGIDGDWAPGGVDVSAYNAAHNVLFLTMHSGAQEGSHKNGAEELWAIDLKRKQVLYRSVVPHLASIAVTNGKQPVLFGLNEDSELIRYAIDPQARFAAKPTHTVEAWVSGPCTQLPASKCHECLCPSSGSPGRGGLPGAAVPASRLAQGG